MENLAPQLESSRDANLHHLDVDDKVIIVVGTAHVSRDSVDLVKKVIAEEKPDTVSVELCPARYQSIVQKGQWQETDLLKVIREKKAFLLLSNLMLSYVQKKIGDKLGVRPGEEMLEALASAEEIGAQIHLADRDIRTTLSRTWRLMGFWTKIKLLVQLIVSVGDIESVSEEDVENLKNKDVLETLLTEMGESLPEVQQILIDERDQYLAYKIRNAPGNKVVAVVGAGHVPGIKRYWDRDVDTDRLEEVPPPGVLGKIAKWVFPALIIGLIIVGFFAVGESAGTRMIKWWVIANGVLAGLGAAAALAHPLTILSAVIAAPITSLNPMIAAGWVAGLVEVFLGKPKVKDFVNLPDDISSIKGFWKNKITRILLVVVFTNIGSVLGTFVAIPLMVRIFA